MELEETTRIRGSPAAAFACFEDMAANYERWHPDHVEFRWIEGDGLAVGSVAHFEEEIAGEWRAHAVRFTAVDPPRLIAFRPTARLVALLMPHVSFTIEEHPDGCTVTQRIRIRTGPIGAWLNRGEFDAVRAHVSEEGVNLKRILEAEA